MIRHQTGGEQGTVIQFIRIIFLLGCACLLVLACSEDDNNPVDSPPSQRPYKMGFSFFPTVFQSAEPNQFITNFQARSDFISIPVPIWTAASR